MTKSVLIKTASIMTAIVMIVCFVKVDNTDEMVLAEVFQNAASENIMSDVEMSVYYGGEYMDENQKKEVITQVAKQLGINDKYDYNQIGTETGYTEILSKKAVNADTCIKMTTVENCYSDHRLTLSQYLYIRIDFDNSPDSTVYYKDRIESILKNMNLDGEVTMNFKTVFNGKLSIQDKNARTDDILHRIKAEKVQSKCTNDIYTVYGYTEYLDKYIMSGGQKINVNIAYSYNEIDNTTEMYVSAPVMSRDY